MPDGSDLPGWPVLYRWCLRTECDVNYFRLPEWNCLSTRDELLSWPMHSKRITNGTDWQKVAASDNSNSSSMSTVEVKIMW
ncbi:hypothetical protein Y032_0082g1591 [Ancylostoma ceylanicum]|uniref:Uncharacterized protein n=1 Tax=Ancylostoma ceylanicum TaxID=53326 RepID=A0A016TS30_9BILA|nr:hypothetical protein Y032_0082g1591 [Ancylostoma ceylanicum]